MICDNLNHHKNLRSDLMARIICIDFGLKRTGLAVTDPLQIIATGLATVHSKELISFLKNYFTNEKGKPEGLP